jgi:hypothetical protein
MGTISWGVFCVMMFFLGFFSSAIFCAAGRDEDLSKAYKRGLKEGMSRYDGK